MERRVRKVPYKGKDEDEGEEEQSMNDDLNHGSSPKRVKSESTSLIKEKTPIKRTSLDAKKTDQAPSKKVVGWNGRMVDQARSFAMKEVVKHRMMNSPLSKAAAAFGLTTNAVKCTFCEESFGAATLDFHFRAMHNAERHLKLFGCVKCNSWHRLPNDAMKHHRQKGCKLSIRTLDEAKNPIRNVPLSKTAATFGLKTNTFDCPHCDESFSCCALDDHIRTVHKAEKMKLFGCEKCNSWHTLLVNAMRHHREKGCKLSVRTADEAKSQLSKTATAFGLKANTLECPFCDESFSAGAIDNHLQLMHKAEKIPVKLFGCDKCNSWYGLPNNALKHQREKGCTLRIRTVNEAKKCNALHGNAPEDEEELDGNESKEGEASTSRVVNQAEAGEDNVAAPTIDYEMASRLTSESIHAVLMATTIEEKPECDKVA